MSFRLPIRPRRRALRLTLALFAALLGASALAQGLAPLPLEEALRIAQARSRQLPAQDAAAAAARQTALAAAELPDPTLRAGIDALPISGSKRFSLVQDDFTMRTIGITQEFTRADKRRARAMRYEREAEAAEAQRLVALARLQRESAVAWLDGYHLARMRELLLAQRDETRLQQEAADAAYRGGRGAQADVFAARSAVALIDDRIAQSERQLATAGTQLARWIGEAAARPLGERPPIDTVALSAEDLETRFAHHPEIAVMLQQEGVALAEADLAEANRHPDWSVSLAYARRGPAYSDYVFASVSVPLQWDQKNRQDRELAARLATVEQMRAEREEATRGHVAETLAMLQEWHSDRGRLERYDTALIPLAAERTRAATSAYRGGSAALPAVLEARRAELDTRIERLRLEMEAARLWAQLSYLIPAGHEAPVPGRNPR